MNVLSWNYIESTNETLDAIYRMNNVSQVSLAEELGVSKRAIEARISKLKKNGLLCICRGINKEIYYCIGEDASMKWSAIDAKAILEHRNNNKNDYTDKKYILRTNEIERSVELDYIVDKFIDLLN